MFGCSLCNQFIVYSIYSNDGKLFINKLKRHWIGIMISPWEIPMLIVPDDISNMRCVVAWHHARQYQQRCWDDLLMLQIGQLNPALPIVFRLVHTTLHQPRHSLALIHMLHCSLGTNSALAQATLQRDKYAMQFWCDLISERILQLHKENIK